MGELVNIRFPNHNKDVATDDEQQELAIGAAAFAVAVRREAHATGRFPTQLVDLNSEATLAGLTPEEKLRAYQISEGIIWESPDIAI